MLRNLDDAKKNETIKITQNAQKYFLFVLFVLSNFCFWGGKLLLVAFLVVHLFVLIQLYYFFLIKSLIKKKLQS